VTYSAARRRLLVSKAAAPLRPRPPVEDPAVKAAREAAQAQGQEPSQQRVELAAAARYWSFLAVTFSPASFVGAFTVFALAVVVGFYVISGVAALVAHPLMAQTNAISGIILVGALLQLGLDQHRGAGMSFVAATIASINIFGGFWCPTGCSACSRERLIMLLQFIQGLYTSLRAFCSSCRWPDCPNRPPHGWATSPAMIGMALALIGTIIHSLFPLVH